MKKPMIALALAALLLVFIACAAQTGTTGSTDMEWGPIEPVTEAFTETAEESVIEIDAAAPVSETPTGTTAAVTTTLPASISATPTTAKVVTTAKPASASSTTAKPAAAPAPVVPTPVTAAQATTTTRYVPPQTSAATSTTRYVPPATTTIPRILPDYEAMGQAQYQEEAMKALNALRAERGLPAMAKSDYLMSTCLAQAQVMAAAGRNIHSEFPPGCESVGFVPYDFPAQVLGEVLAHHVSQFLTDADRVNVGIAVVRDGNYLYAVMQGAA